MRSYTQLIQEEPYQAEALIEAGNNLSEIAHILERSKSTISNEV